MKMNLSKTSPNLQSFFEKGFDTLYVDDTITNHLAGFVLTEQYGKGTYPGIENPLWDRDYLDLDDNFYANQQKYVDIIKQVLAEPYFKYWNEIYGTFDNFKVSVNRMNAGTDMVWHWDGFDGTLIQLLFYMETQDSGEFEVGKVSQIQVNDTDSFPHWQPAKGLNHIEGNVETTGKIKIETNKLIVLNNYNPCFVHRVNTTNTLRHSVIVSCGYKSVWENNKIKEYDIEE